MPDRVYRMRIDENGMLYGVYNDALAPLLQDKKKVFVKRISDVSFNNETREWEVVLFNGQIIASDKLRERAIDKEIQYLNDHPEVLKEFREKYSPFAGSDSGPEGDAAAGSGDPTS